MRALLVVALVGGCSGANPGAVQCARDVDCKGTRICVAGQCVDSESGDLAPAAPLDGGDLDGALAPDGGDLAIAPLDGGDLAILDSAGDGGDLAGFDGAVVDGGDLAIVDGANDLPGPLDLGGADLAPRIAWGAPCTAASACAAPPGETGACALSFGTPACLHTCNALPDYGSCEAGKGICIPVGGGAKYCFARCGDLPQLQCAPGTGCALVGRAVYGGANYPVGACVASCTAGGPDACTRAGTTCDPVTSHCVDSATCGGCAAGTTCQPNGSCNPPSPSPLYGSCTALNPSCADQLCYGDVLGGSCARFCDSSASGLQACGAGGTCWTDIDVTPEAPNDSGVVTVDNGSFIAAGGRTVGLCLKSCTTASDCPFGWHCAEINGRRGCLMNPDPSPSITSGSQQPGDPCTSSGDCVSNNCVLQSTAWRYGACGRVSTAVACPAGTTADAATPLLCHKNCTGTIGGECPATQVCNPVKGWCEVALCRSSGDCSFLGQCSTQAAACQSAPATSGGAVGAACTVDGDCLSGRCSKPSGTLWPGGYCSAPCQVNADFTDSCPSGSVCGPMNAGGLYIGVEGQCLALCDAGAVARFGSCRVGYKCTPFAYDPRFGACVSM
ncbi:MAG TPA: hypothetical protein VFF06_24910 [Polyangia bacterium]|nr:hypothetical protein [Polyangia bacterium]